jgi:large subunit ribosomal protein L20
MPRVRKGHATRRKHNRILNATKGFYGSGSRHYRIARQLLIRAGTNRQRGRKGKKREFRALWITRISAACKQRGLTYSKLIASLFWADITLNRKMLSEIAIHDPAAFDQIVAAAQAAKAAAPEAAAV